MKKIKILILLSLLHSISFKLQAQHFIIYGDKTFGGNADETNVSIALTDSNQFLLIGDSHTDLNGDKTEGLCDLLLNQYQDIWVLKIDNFFNILWNRDIGGDRVDNHPFLLSLKNAGQFILSCSSNSDSTCDKNSNSRNFPNVITANDYWICLMDSFGNKIWDKTIGSTDADILPRTVQLANGDFVVGGGSIGGISGDKTEPSFGNFDYWLIKIDNQGNKKWDKVYGGSGVENFSVISPWYFDLTADSNECIILSGSTSSPADGTISQPPKGGFDIWIAKLDSSGNIIWDKRFGGSGADKSEKLIRTLDDGYILCGITSSPQGGDVSETTRGGQDIWVIKLDSVGNKLWDKRYGGNNSEFPISIVQEINGRYIISGTTGSDSSGDVSEQGYGGYDYWIFEIDSAGNKLWDKRFGGPGGDTGGNFIIMADSSIFFAGDASPGTSATKTDSGKGGTDYWVVHFKYIDSIATGMDERIDEAMQFNLAPNPATNNITVSFSSLNSNSFFNLTVFDIAGKEVLQQTLLKSSSQMDISKLRKGIYIVELKDISGHAAKK
ncbi:MAG: T9SS type A sorting domain-containing protein, partial [Bacteroidota bacterium]